MKTGMERTIGASTTIGFALLAALLLGYVSIFSNVLLDDAFITLRYVRTIESSGTWGFFPGYTANTATSPLNVLLLVVVSQFAGSPITAVLWLTVVELLALAYVLKGVGERLRLPFFPWLAFLGFAANPWVMSTVGLEGTLQVLLISAVAYCVVANRDDASAVACALLTLTRADGILLAAVVVLFVAAPRRWRFAAVFIGAIAPWYLFSWIHLGSLIPDSLLIKANDPWGEYTFVNGLRLYAALYPVQTTLAFLALPAAFFAAAPAVRRLGPVVAVLAAYAALHFAAYSALRAGPSHWYYVPEVASVVLLGALVVSVWCRELHDRRPRVARAVAGVALGVPVVGMCWLLGDYGLPLRETLVHANWATPEHYRTVGRWLKEHHGHETGEASTEIGALAYYCDCYLLNQFGDRSWVSGRIAHDREDGGLRGAWSRVNYFFYRPQPKFPPPTYWLTVQQRPDAADSGVPPWEISSRWRAPQWLTWTSHAP